MVRCTTLIWCLYPLCSVKEPYVAFSWCLSRGATSHRAHLLDGTHTILDSKCQEKIGSLASFAALALLDLANLARSTEPNWLTWLSKDNPRKYRPQDNLAKKVARPWFFLSTSQRSKHALKFERREHRWKEINRVFGLRNHSILNEMVHVPR
jgi:hypothetical protein